MAKSRKSKKRGNASVVGRRNAGPRQLLPVKGLRLLAAILAELKGLREDVCRYSKERESEEGAEVNLPAVADANRKGDAVADQQSKHSEDDLRPTAAPDSRDEESVPPNDVAPEKESQPQDQPIDQVGIVHDEVVSAGEGKRRHKPIDLLVKIYEFLEDGKEAAAIGDQELLFHRVNIQKTLDENNYVTPILHFLSKKQCIKPVREAQSLTDPMKAIGRKEKPVLEWALLPLGVEVARRELLRRN
jgi:hypothetical protein